MLDQRWTSKGICHGGIGARTKKGTREPRSMLMTIRHITFLESF